MGANDQLTFL